MILFLDTSALVKLYIDEPGAAEVEDLVARAERISVSWVACAEARSAFARLSRARALAPAAHEAAVRALDRDWMQLDRVEVGGAVGVLAGRLAARHGLRGFDAIHLACGLRVSLAVGNPCTFATFDRALRVAAASEGLTADL